MNVSVFSDAGLCDRGQASSWGGWIKSDRGLVRGGGVLKYRGKHPGLAEASAACNSLWLGLHKGVIRRGDKILLQTDNSQVEAILYGRIAQTSDTHLELAGWFKLLLMQQTLTVDWRHVRGHQASSDPRHAVNNGCDLIATYYLQKARRGLGWRVTIPDRPFGLSDICA